MSELLKGCRLCGAIPRKSSMAGISIENRHSINFVCCRVSKGARSEEDAAYNWNVANLDSPVTYRKNQNTKVWEKVENDNSKSTNN